MSQAMSQANTPANDELDLINDVPEGGGAFKQYGKLTLSTRFLVWRDGKPVEVEAAEWKKLPQKDTNGKNTRSMEIVFKVDIQEFKTSLQFTYERKVQVNGLDWYKIVAPSIEALMGKGSMAKGTQNTTLHALSGKYVAVDDVPQIDTKTNANRSKYNTIKFVKVFESREACYMEFKALSGSNGTEDAASESDPMVPADYSKADWLSCKGDIEAAIAKAVEAAGKVPAKRAQARTAAIAEQATQYAASVEQVEALLKS